MNTRLLLGPALGSILIAASCSSVPEEGAPAPAAPDQEVGAAESAVTVPSSPLRRADGFFPGVIPWRGNPQIAVTPACNTPKLAYFGGPILQNPVIVAVFWNSNVNAALTAPTTGIGQFYADVTQSAYWKWLQEYDTVGTIGGMQGTNQAILPGSFFGNVTLTPSRCPATTTAACTVSDTQLQTELKNQIASNALPAPTFDCTGNSNTIYMVHFPPNITVTGPAGSGKSCQQFCAYHNTGTYGTAQTPLIYGVLMDEFTGPCKTGCGGNATALENSTDTASHELAEAATDPDIGLDMQNNYANPAGWGDNNNNCGEIGDICDSGGAGDTITVNGRTWSVQQLWSNAQNKCTSTGPANPLAVCSGTTLTGCRKCSCGDNGGACTGATSFCEATSTNVLFGACEQCTATSGNCTAPATCAQSTTPAQDDICPGSTCVPLTSCPAGQSCGTASNGCGGTLTCGTCVAPATCGGGGVANQCGTPCTPLTICPGGQNCGTASDGCGGTLTCGVCSAPRTCGGGGVANQCGCTALTTCPAGDDCGSISDNCGGQVNCGNITCPGKEVCTNNHCISSGSSSSSSAASSSSSSGAASSSSSSAASGSVSSSSGFFGNGGAGTSVASSSGAGGSAAEGAGGSGSGGIVQKPGCGCETVGDPVGSTTPGLSAFGALALIATLRDRKRRRI